MALSRKQNSPDLKVTSPDRKPNQLEFEPTARPGHPESLIQNQSKTAQALPERPESAPRIIGINLGSASVKVVLLEGNFNIIERLEAPVKGSPLDTLKSLLARLSAGDPGGQLIIGVTGAGSGSVNFPEGVCLANEIVALAAGASVLNPGLSSVIEIGAETSRWIQLGPAQPPGLEQEILDFALNERCAAGTISLTCLPCKLRSRPSSTRSASLP